MRSAPQQFTILLAKKRRWQPIAQEIVPSVFDSPSQLHRAARIVWLGMSNKSVILWVMSTWCNKRSRVSQDIAICIYPPLRRDARAIRVNPFGVRICSARALIAHRGVNYRHPFIYNAHMPRKSGWLMPTMICVRSERALLSAAKFRIRRRADSLWLCAQNHPWETSIEAIVNS